MVSTSTKSMPATRPGSNTTPSTVISKPTTQEIYCRDRVVRFMGRVYWVKWCNGTHVCLTAKQGLYRGIYQPYPMKSFDLNEWTVPISHPFLSIV